jgi:signal transduction histidine kinase
MVHRQHRLPTFVLIVVLVAVVPAGVLQFHLLTRASEAEAANLQRLASAGVRQIRSEIGYEIAGLVSIVSTWDSEGDDLSSLTALYDAWRLAARYPALIPRIVVARTSDANPGVSFFVYGAGESGFAALSPDAIPWLHSVRFDRSDGAWLGPGEAHVLTIPPTADEPDMRVFIPIDRAALAGDVVAGLIEEHLGSGPEAFQAAVLDVPNATVLYSTAKTAFEDFAFSSGAGPAREARIVPDEAVPLVSPGVAAPIAASLFAMAGERMRDPLRTVPRDNPAVQRWLTLLKWTRVDDSVRTRELQSRDAGIVLAVWHPAGTIHVAAKQDRNLNLALSYVFLAGVALMALVFHALYRRTQRQRTREQEFVATVTHELRTPVAATYASAENLAEGVVTQPERVREYGRSLVAEGQRLKLLIDQTLHLAGLQSGSRSDVRTVRLDALVASIVALETRVGDHNVTVDVDPDVREGLVDETAVRSIVGNLLSNAVKHNPSGTRIGVLVDMEHDGRLSWLRIVVTDEIGRAHV